MKIGIADENTLFRKSLSFYLRQHADIQILIDTDTITELSQQIKCTPVEIILIGWLNNTTGDIKSFTHIQNDHPHVKIVVITDEPEIAKMSHLTEKGIHAFISKDADPGCVVDALHSTYDNKIYRNRLYSEVLFFHADSKLKRTPRRAKVVLTAREKAVIQLLWQEKTNKEIAAEVFLSIRSIEKIRQDLKEKLGTKTTAGLFRYALEYGLFVNDSQLA